MLGHSLQFCGGLVLLLFGGRLLVSASVDTARRLGVSPLVVGLTLVAWGTSAPELALNLISAVKGRSDLALGNVVGANICNIALVLGMCALIRPLVVQERLIRVEIWLNAAILGMLSLLGLTAGFQRWQRDRLVPVQRGSDLRDRRAVRAAGRGRLARRPARVHGDPGDRARSDQPHGRQDGVAR